jgi:LacI family transcriptional regulator
MKPKATLKKIAEKLQISISTVSRALKDHPDISLETRKKVREFAEMMEYEPNTYAISLRTNHSKVFAIIVPAITNFFYQSFISAVEEESRLHGYSLMILQSGDNPETELDNLKLCRQNRVAGLFVSITIKTTDIRAFLKMEDLDVPVIFFDKVPDFEACNKVCVADRSAAEMAAEALLRHKRKKILALFGNDQMSITRKRKEAFTAVIEGQKKIKFKADHAHNPEEARRLIHRYFEKGIAYDGIFCMSDDILTGVMKAVQELKYVVPKEVSVIAMSDGFLPQLYEPEISFVETSGYKLGKVAFTRMLACLSGSTFVQEIMVDAVLMERGSL